MKKTDFIRIKTQSGQILRVPLEDYGDREAGKIFIDGVPYHIERMPKALLCTEYKIDTDPDYTPQSDDANRCVMVSPFSKQ